MPRGSKTPQLAAQSLTSASNEPGGCETYQLLLIIAGLKVHVLIKSAVFMPGLNYILRVHFP
ncbi:hypothetical protein D7V94_16590 [Parablautia intestinalis]|uniref:Uncharacterized protein n=1 Tax=Parablautia intestinalis TaxID=2320100 RepID=A0A3A9AEH7_9FIRM|nr:hypothetical protein D7V94_16590 [Parablautia intestinalis]